MLIVLLIALVGALTLIGITVVLFKLDEILDHLRAEADVRRAIDADRSETVHAVLENVQGISDRLHPSKPHFVHRG